MISVNSADIQWFKGRTTKYMSANVVRGNEGREMTNIFRLKVVFLDDYSFKVGGGVVTGLLHHQRLIPLPRCPFLADAWSLERAGIGHRCKFTEARVFISMKKGTSLFFTSAWNREDVIALAAAVGAGGRGEEGGFMWNGDDCHDDVFQKYIQYVHAEITSIQWDTSVQNNNISISW